MPLTFENHVVSYPGRDVSRSLPHNVAGSSFSNGPRDSPQSQHNSGLQFNKHQQTSLQSTPTQSDHHAQQSAAEGRRLDIGNLAYATSDGDFKEFFKGYLV